MSDRIRNVQDEQPRAIKLLLMDVDGVMTDGKLLQRARRGWQHGGDQGLRFAGRHRAAVAELERHQDRA